LQKLAALDYYSQTFPKSLANDFGTDVVYPLVRSFGLTHFDELRTVVEHVVQQVIKAIENVKGEMNNAKMLVTGGGAFNTFLVDRLRKGLAEMSIELVVPEADLINYKEALIMALIGVLRWRQEATVLSSVTGAERSSIGGALWIGHEA